MKSLTLIAAVTALAAAAPFVSQAQPAPDGEATFNQRCAVCHEGGSGPPKSVLATHTPAQIVDILTNGVMAPMAAGLSDAEKGAIAAYLTKAATPAAPAVPSNTPSPAAPSTTASQTPPPATNTPAP